MSDSYVVIVSDPSDPINVTVEDGETFEVTVSNAPGPPGADGAVDQADLDFVVDVVTDEILGDLEPPIDLTILFENALA